MWIRKHADQERMNELCTLAVLGEIGSDDMLVLSAHLGVCQKCRQLVKELDDIARFDLSASAAARIDGQPHHEIDPAHEAELLSRLVGKVEENTLRQEQLHEGTLTIVPACPVPFRHRIRIMLRWIYPIAGWVTSGALAIFLISSHFQKPTAISPSHFVTDSHDVVLKAESYGWRDRALEAEKNAAATHQNLEASKLQVRSSAQALAEASARYQELIAEKQEFETQLTSQEAKLRQQASVLNLAQASLDDERSDAATLRAQLQDVSAHLNQQRSEMARLQEVAATVPARMPAQLIDEKTSDGREIFGARDLHIVDVYDVDHAGKASRTYGRVYYVNRSLLLFYAFDLDHSAKLRKPVAFQAWGFRQPDSKTAESLGLFYLEDPKLDRWTLRVSDPRLLARIDSLFVTVEPPGGSIMPRGRRLLFASMAGPPNHP